MNSTAKIFRNRGLQHDQKLDEKADKFAFMFQNRGMKPRYCIPDSKEIFPAAVLSIYLELFSKEGHY